MTDVNRMSRVWLAVVILAGGILIGGLWFVPGSLGAHTGGGGMMGPEHPLGQATGNTPKN